MFKPINTAPRPVNRATASQDPTNTPSPLASRQAKPLTHSERATMDHKAVSSEKMSEKAVEKLWLMEFMQTQ